MTTRVHSELRKLALAYYRGWIPREKYLSIRHKYLEAVSNDRIPEPIDPRQIAAPAREPSYAETKKRKNRLGMAAAFAGIVVIALVLAYVFSGDDTPTRPPTPAIVQQSQIEQPMEAITNSTVAVEEKPLSDDELFTAYLDEHFIGQRSWGQDTLDSLKLKWLGLNLEQQSSVRQTPVFREFTNSLIERIVDERALNNIVPSDYELALMTVAKNFGVINEIPEP